MTQPMRKLALHKAFVELKATRENIRALQEAEKALVARLHKEFEMSGKDVFTFGSIVAMREEGSRTSLDRAKLEVDLGEKIKQYERVTEYYSIRVKEVNQ